MALRGGPLRSSSSAVSVPGWRVEDFHRLLTNFFVEGVVQGVGSELAVVQRAAGANMSVDVGTGLALIEFTTTLLSPNETVKSWLNNDAVINVAVPAADLSNPRKDRIVAKFDVSVDPNTAASDIVSVELVEGTPAGSPSAPAEPSNSITLSIVDVPAGDTAITDGQITDSRPFVTLSTDVLADVARLATLAATTNGNGASLIGVEDSGGDYAATDVEGVFAEIADNITTIENDIIGLQGAGVYGDGSDGALSVPSGTTTLDAAGANILVKQYTSISISSGATLTISNPASDGTILILLCQGNVTIDGTINMASMGATGGTQVSVTRTSNGETSSAGNRGTEPFNRLGQVRTGTPGNADTDLATTACQAASGAGGSASTVTAGSASTQAVDTNATAAAASAGDAITSALIALAAQLGIVVSPGAGGSTGGVAVSIETYASGTFTATSGPGGRGGGGLLITCGGTLSFGAAGVINLSGEAATISSRVHGSASADSGEAAGGSAGGAAGCGAAFVKGAITNSGTITVTAGANGAQVQEDGVATAAGASGDGAFAFCRSLFQ